MALAMLYVTPFPRRGIHRCIGGRACAFGQRGRRKLRAVAVSRYGLQGAADRGAGWEVSLIGFDLCDHLRELVIEPRDLFFQLGDIGLITPSPLYDQRKIGPVEHEVDPFPLGHSEHALALRLMLLGELAAQQTIEMEMGELGLDLDGACNA